MPVTVFINIQEAFDFNALAAIQDALKAVKGEYFR